MKIQTSKKLIAAVLTAAFCFGCSTNSIEKQTGETAQNANQASANSPAVSAASPCANKFYPVKDGLKKNYKNAVGGDTAQVMEYADSAAQFTEVMTLKDINVKHVWNCTDEGLIAANYGSAASMSDVKLEPKHISGVTVPREDEFKVGKTWTAVYQSTGSSPLGAVDSTVTLNHKIVSLDDEVKTPGGIFKAAKIEVELVSDMKTGGKKIPVPNVKSTSWYAPDIGMVKSTGNIMGVANTMEYKGGN